jgi:agmatinase
MLKHSQLFVAILLVPVVLAHQTVLSAEPGRPPKSIAPDELWEGRQWDLTFSGPLAFEHMNYTKCLADDNINFDMAVLGFPFDNKVTYRPG